MRHSVDVTILDVEYEVIVDYNYSKAYPPSEDEPGAPEQIEITGVRIVNQSINLPIPNWLYLSVVDFIELHHYQNLCEEARE